MLDTTAADQAFEAALARSLGEPGDLIPLLQAAQVAYGYVPEAAMLRVAETLDVPLTELYGVVTFYKQFRLTPRGKYMVRVCDGTACHVNGSVSLIETITDVLGVGPGETDKDANFTLETVACLGCCSLAPVIVVNEDTHGRLNPQKLRTILNKLKREATGGRKEPATNAANA
jgi:NADH-quinone oxidoreductase subunit E